MSKEEYIPQTIKSVDGRSARAMLDAVDMALSLKQPVRVTIDGNTVSYDFGEETLHKSPATKPVASEDVIYKPREKMTDA